eukprot:gi/632944204/ref/XP_007887371.1/ PREDICTED: death domain-containing protein 1 [Callorhinchus milii]
MTEAENISHLDNVINIIDSVQRQNHILKCLLQKTEQLEQKDQGVIKQSIDTVLFLSEQISIDILEKLRSTTEILQTTTEIVAGLCQQKRTNIDQIVNPANLNYLEWTSNFLNHLIASLKSAETNLYDVKWPSDHKEMQSSCTGEEKVELGSDMQHLQTGSPSYHQKNGNSEEGETKKKGAFETSLSNSQNNQHMSEKTNTILITEKGHSVQESSCSFFQPSACEGVEREDTAGDKEHFQASSAVFSKEENYNRQLTIQKAGNREEHVKSPFRITEDMDSKTEVEDSGKTLKSIPFSNQGGSKDIHLSMVSKTSVTDRLKINKFHDQNEITDSAAQPVRSRDPQSWSQTGLLAELNAESDPQIPCYVTAPFMIIQKLICRIINDRSSLVIYDGEELVSNVISIQCSDSRIKIPFPIRIAIPFTASYRGHYREIMVKVSDGSLCSSYMSPISLEGIYDGHKGTYAEIKVYKLGIFSVVSCLKKERFTVPKKGLALKLSMDGRIALNYLPGTFSAPVIVQSKVQPIDTTLLSTLKARQDVYHSIVSTSPIVHITHPSTQQFRKSIAIIVPCPPNPDKKRLGDETDHGRAATAMVHRSSSHRIRSMSAPVKKHGEPANESLKLLGFKCRDEQWFLMDAITVKNGQNGLVEFEIAEHVERFIVLRLSSSVDSSYLVSFIQELEEAIQFTMVNIVMYHRRDNFHKAVVQLVPSKDSPWELAKLREKGYRGPPEPSEEFPMREGEQLILKFSGNIKSLGNEGDVTQGYQLIFHSQRKTRLELELNEVDEFGNYCSPHYKGMAIFYKVTKEELTKQWDGADNAVESQQRSPVCKLALTLPKRERTVNRSVNVIQIPTEPSKDAVSDNVLYWVASELSEEDALLLFTSLRIRRSAIQLVKLTNPDDLTHQIFKLLSMWKKSLPTSADKQRLLSRHLNKCSRQDLVEDLQSKWKIGEEK